jgi:CheY-like chemotaxis protein
MEKEPIHKKVYSVEIIGVGLALLYVTSCLVFLQYFKIPGFEQYSGLYIALFGLLAVGSMAVVRHKEWGRKLLIALSAIMFICISARYVPRINIVPLGYLFLNIIVLLYFTQAKIKWQFHTVKYASWNKSILLVDDDEVVIKTLRPVLLSHGYAVLTAMSGEDGLQIARRQKPDLIILDVILPGIKGRQVCQQLKGAPETAGIPVVFLTSKDSPEDLKAEKELGAAGHITKPVNMRLLVETIHGILRSGEAKKKR